MCRLLVHPEFRDSLGIAKSMDSFNEIIKDIEEKCRVCIHVYIFHMHQICANFAGGIKSRN